LKPIEQAFVFLQKIEYGLRKIWQYRNDGFEAVFGHNDLWETDRPLALGFE
jgi:hypothetical protein